MLSCLCLHHHERCVSVNSDVACNKSQFAGHVPSLSYMAIFIMSFTLAELIPPPQIMDLLILVDLGHLFYELVLDYIQERLGQHRLLGQKTLNEYMVE